MLRLYLKRSLKIWTKIDAGIRNIVCELKMSTKNTLEYILKY